MAFNIWPFGKKEAPRQRKMQRGFSAAQISRLTQSWGTGSNSLDFDLKTQLTTLRARSRDLCTNNDYARKFLQMCATHVVGPSGFALQVRVSEIDAKGAKTIDKLASTAIEDAFYKWARRGNCDVTGRLSFYDICNLYIKAVARDGEVLVRKVYGSNAGPYGFQLQILDIDRLDVDYNEELRNGSRIKMGVELNRYGKPMAYHVRIAHPGDSPHGYTWSGKAYERIPAEDVFHHFISDRPEQNRGVPWMASAMMRLQNLGGYEEAAVIAARVGASKMGFFTSPEGDGAALQDGTDETGTPMQDAEPGRFDVLPEGWGFESFNPDYPHAMYADFIKACLRGVASGLGVSYNTLSNDLEGVNFSSIRTGVLEERDNWMGLQNWMIEQFLDEVFSTWLRFALISGGIKLPTGNALPASKFDKFNAATWQGRRWQWVDPMKDVQANIAAINANLKSRSDVIAEQGRDAEETFDQLALEKEQLDSLGLMPAAPEPAAGTPADNSEDNTDNTDTGKGNKNG